MPSSREWRSQGYMTIFREHPEGVVIFLINRETSDIRWAPTNEGEWRLVQEYSEFNELDSEVAKVLPVGEVLWLFENCTCDQKTCGHCSKERTGVPELEKPEQFSPGFNSRGRRLDSPLLSGTKL